MDSPKGTARKLYRISAVPSVFHNLGLTAAPFVDQKKAVEAVRIAGAGRGMNLSESVEEDCTVFRNKEGGEVARILAVDGPRWR